MNLRKPMTEEKKRCGTLTPKQAARAIVRELRRLGDPKKAASTQRFFKEPVQSLGIDAPTSRSTARAWVERLKSVWHLKEAASLCDRLLRRPHVEIRAVGFLVLSGFNEQFDRALLRRFEWWVRRYLDNWALVDGFCGTVLSPLLERYPKVEHTLNSWSGEDSLWLRRAALVTLVPFARRGRRLSTAYRLAREHFADSEDLMHKATGWLLREAGRTDPSRLKAFLLRHRAAIPRTTVRYAIEQYPAAERAELLQATRRSSDEEIRFLSWRKLLMEIRRSAFITS